VHTEGEKLRLLDRLEYEPDYNIGQPHEDNTDGNVDDDFARVFHLLLISTTSHELESSIDNIDSPHESDKSEEVSDDISHINRDGFVREKIAENSSRCRESTTQTTFISTTTDLDPIRVATVIGPIERTSEVCMSQSSREEDAPEKEKY
jgi:hypothetical protein